MAKHTTYLGKNEIEYEIDESQKLFPETSKIKSNIKPDTNYLDTELCNIPEPPQTTVKIPNIPFTDIPTPMPPIEVPKTLLASLLPCAKKGLFPCPDIRIKETFEMTDEELGACDPQSTLRIPITIAMDYKKLNPDYEFTDDPAVDGIMGYVYIHPFFVSKCCCEAENDEDVIEIRVGWYYQVVKPQLKLPRVNFPCPELTFKTKVQSNKYGSNYAQRKDVGKIDLELEAEADENDCRKLQINANMLFSIPDMVKAVRWENVAQNGCLTAKKLVVDRADLVVFDNRIQFCPATRTEDLMFAPVEEANLLSNPGDQPVSGEYTVISSIEHNSDGDSTTISWRESKLKFSCGRLVSVSDGRSDYVTISAGSGNSGGQGEHDGFEDMGGGSL